LQLRRAEKYADQHLFDISGWHRQYNGMNASDRAHAFPDGRHHSSVRVHRHQHSHRRKRFHYRPEALGKEDWGWRLTDVDFRQLLARKGLVRLALVLLFVGLPLAGLQLSIWLLGSEQVHKWLMENGPDALMRFVR